MLIGNFSYPVIAKTKIGESGRVVPVVDVPMISDQKWTELTSTPEQIRLREQLRKAGVLHG